MAESRAADSISYNVRGLLTQAERLARTEVELALAKGRDSISETVRMVIMVVVAGVFALGGTAFLLQAIYTGLSMRVESWLAALLTALIAFGGAFLFLRLGVSRKADVAEPESLDGRRTSVVVAR